MSSILDFLKPKFDKEGKGVEKGENKSTFGRFFSAFFTNFWKFIPLNLLYWVMSLPVLTLGISSSGLTNIARTTALGKHSFGFSDFFDTIKKYWKKSLAVGIINAVITAVISLVVMYYWNSGKGFSKLLGFSICISVILIFLIMNLYIPTLLITFDYSVKQLYKNSFKFCFVNLFGNITALAAIAVSVALFGSVGALALWIAGKKGVYICWILALLFIAEFPLYKFLLIQYFVFPVIRKTVIDPYYAEHPDADIEKRKNLGIYDEPETDENIENEEE